MTAFFSRTLFQGVYNSLLQTRGKMLLWEGGGLELKSCAKFLLE